MCMILYGKMILYSLLLKHPDIKVQFEDEGRDKKGKKYCYPSLWTIKRGNIIVTNSAVF